MTVWQNPKRTNSGNVWINPKKAQMGSMDEIEHKKSPLPGEGLGLGLAQWAVNTLQGLSSHGAEPEVDIPSFLRHEKLNNNPTQRPNELYNFEQHVDPSQQLQFNVGKYAPDVIGLGATLAKGASKLTSKSIGSDIVNNVKNLKKYFKNEYGSIFNEAEKQGIKNYQSKASRKELENIMSSVDKKYYSGLEKFLDNPTTRNAHLAQSDLGKLIRKLSGKRQLFTSEHEALKSARNAQDILKKEVYSNLLKEGGLKLPFKYNDVTKRYSREMVPYLENTAVRRASLNPGQKGYIKPSRLPGKLKNESSDPLMAHLRGKDKVTKEPINPYLKGKYPLLEVNQALRPILKYGAIGGLGYTGYDLIKSLLGNHS
jgi:hypothetical protein